MSSLAFKFGFMCAQTLIFLHSCRHRRKTKTPEEIKAEEVKSGTKPVRTASGLKVAQVTKLPLFRPTCGGPG